MLNTGSFNGFVFVVDTSEYSGAFEREMTAYCTGQIGECHVGVEYVKEFEATEDQKSFFERHVISGRDDHGYSRPATIWQTPGFWSDGLGNHWPASMHGSQEAKEKYHQACLEHGITPRSRVPEWPTYQSVGMLFDTEPPFEIRELLVKRAHAFLARYRKNTGVAGFRVIQIDAGRLETLWSAKV